MSFSESESISKKSTIRKVKEKVPEGKEKSESVGKRPWRQAVRHRAKRKRKAAEEETENTGSVIGSGCSTKKRKRNNKLGKKKRAKKRRQLNGDKEEEVGQSDAFPVDWGDNSPLTSMDASRFRFLNEQLCSQTSATSAELFQKDPDSFRLYHRGYKHQLSKWPVNPLDKIVLELGFLPPESVVADLGCGEAEIAKRMGGRFQVHSFDLVASNERVSVADMAELPLESESVDVCVYCLSLMGTNLAQFFREAHRVLKMHGKIKIAEITSRFRSFSTFMSAVQKMGFQMKRKKLISDGFFVMLTLEKVVEKITNKRPKDLRLKPFLYKKR
uniref:Ribosomal RNA-processing protein 8 n=1 Tax=Globodera rostochiensis TaxID=31243 RepID=A0A914H2U8_GLORO